MTKTQLLAISCAALFTAPHQQASASTVSELVPVGVGVPYRWEVELGTSDLASLTRHVGAWSWEDESLFVPGNPTVGWTHNADWVTLTLTAPALLTLRFEALAGVPMPVPEGNPPAFYGANLFPGFTLWSGEDTDGDQVHSFSNKGDVAWAEDLAYITHRGPATTGSLESRHILEQSFPLDAGTYTFVLGGNSESTVAEGRQGYQATFTTSVPEPGTTGLLALGALALLNRRRRSS
ncbi:MAG: PEP-CTERM sorting domain-containing protein [Chthoniobacteraceae bacterium]